MSLSSDDEHFKSAITGSEQKYAGDSTAAQQMRVHPSYPILVKTISELEADIRGLVSSFEGMDYPVHWQKIPKIFVNFYR